MVSNCALCLDITEDADDLQENAQKYGSVDIGIGHRLFTCALRLDFDHHGSTAIAIHVIRCAA